MDHSMDHPTHRPYNHYRTPLIPEIPPAGTPPEQRPSVGKTIYLLRDEDFNVIDRFVCENEAHSCGACGQIVFPSTYLQHQRECLPYFAHALGVTLEQFSIDLTLKPDHKRSRVEFEGSSLQQATQAEQPPHQVIRLVEPQQHAETQPHPPVKLQQPAAQQAQPHPPVKVQQPAAQQQAQPHPPEPVDRISDFEVGIHLSQAKCLAIPHCVKLPTEARDRVVIQAKWDGKVTSFLVCHQSHFHSVDSSKTIVSRLTRFLQNHKLENWEAVCCLSTCANRASLRTGHTIGRNLDIDISLEAFFCCPAHMATVFERVSAVNWRKKKSTDQDVVEEHGETSPSVSKLVHTSNTSASGVKN